MPGPIHWSKLFRGPLATVVADGTNTVEIEREVIPIIFVPGIMGSRLKRTRDGPDGGSRRVVWDPDDYTFVAAMAATDYRTVREWVIGENFDPDYLAVIGRTADGAVDEGDRSFYLDKVKYRGYPGAFERGWAGVYQGSYVPFLKDLTRNEWSEPIRHCFELPVHAFGYNWTQSNLSSGRQLADYVRQTVAYYGEDRECERAILVTHSMGGLATRAAVKALEGSDILLGVVHGAQPSPGSPLSYWRMKGGLSGALGVVIGNTGPKATILLGNMPGGLELLPNRNYRTNPTGGGTGSALWLSYPDPGTGAPVLRPATGDPYQEIYRERDQFYRLVDPSWLNPVRPLDRPWDHYVQYLRIAEAYHEQLDGYAHPDTVQFHATDVSTQDRVEFERRPNSSWEWKWKFWEGGYARGVHPDGRVWDDHLPEEPEPTGEGGGLGGRIRRLFGRGDDVAKPDWLMYLEITDATGDGTVSDGAGRYLDLGDDERTVEIDKEVEPKDGYREHQDVYNSPAVRHVAQMAIENLCLKRIDQVVGGGTGGSGPPGGPGSGPGPGGGRGAPPGGPPSSPPGGPRGAAAGEPRVVRSDPGTPDARRDLARGFYRDEGYEEHQIDGHLDGIDFDQPVDVVALPEDTLADQWQVPGGRQGSYYAPPGTRPGQLGINPQGLDKATGAVVDKVPTTYRATAETRALRSTTRPVIDHWSVKGTEYAAEGGGTQFMTRATTFVRHP